MKKQLVMLMLVLTSVIGLNANTVNSEEITVNTLTIEVEKINNVEEDIKNDMLEIQKDLTADLKNEIEKELKVNSKTIL